jgi:hypothetical protein
LWYHSEGGGDGGGDDDNDDDDNDDKHDDKDDDDGYNGIDEYNVYIYKVLNNRISLVIELF